jgi:hypothetical protein
VDSSSAGQLVAEQERRVRRHAQRVLSAVVRRATVATPIVELDLSGAALEEFRLDDGEIGMLRLDGGCLTGPTELRGVRIGELTMTGCVTDDDVVLDQGRVDRLVLRGKDARIGGRFIYRCDLGSVDIESVDFRDSVELSDLEVTGRFAAHTDFRRLAMTRVVFVPPVDDHDDTSLDLFRCEFAGLVLFDDVTVRGGARFAGVRFKEGLRLRARFDQLVTVEEALVATARETVLPPGWRIDEHDAAYRRLVAPAS